jgi:hypothetical protein
VVHPLPPAPHFVGRDAERSALRNLWQAGFRGVVALVGLGGAGKTAVAARFLDELQGPAGTPRPDGLFVWSFYQEPDAGLFLREAYRYFSRSSVLESPARGAGLLHLLRDALGVGGPHLLVLDGLERVQQQGGDGEDGYGQVEEPLLAGLLTRVAEGVGQTTVLVTSRFPLTDLEPFAGGGYRYLDVGGLDREAARALLGARGVRGDDAALDSLIDAYGAHALTLDHLGGLVGKFLEGDPACAPEMPALMPGEDRQALRLARLLRAYESHLPAAELALLCRLCLLRRSVTEEQIVPLFLCAPVVHTRTARELGEAINYLSSSDKYPEELRSDLASSIQVTIEEALCAAPLAGPEGLFRQEVLRIAENVFQGQDRSLPDDIEELARLYAGKDLDGPSDQLPFSVEERIAFRFLHERYLKLRDHPLLPGPKPPAVLKQAFQYQGMWGHLFAAPGANVSGEAMTSADVLRAWQKTQQQLRHLTGKHFALRQVRALCRVHQQKWSLAGPLAELDAPALRQVLDALVGRHLVLREADGQYSVHPAVRDHFYRLASASQGETWHDLIREQLVSLVRRPGRHLPEDPASLDLVEEAIHHSLQAGRSEQAVWLYTHVLGGLRHLGWKLGEMARGLRLLRGFQPCPDSWALGWFLRALGQLEAAYEHNTQPCFRADIRLLQGRLPEVAAEGDDGRALTAAFLMGQTSQLPPDLLGCAIPRDQILLYRGRLDSVRRTDLLQELYQEIGREGDRARCQLLAAEAARRQADRKMCRKYLDAASGWVLRSGSVEHLCLMHWVRARAARGAGDSAAAQRAVDEGLHVARQAGFGLYQIELSCEAAELRLMCSDGAGAEELAREALRRASAAECQYRWGAASAGHLLGQALAMQGRVTEACVVLEETLELRGRLGDPEAEATEQVLGALGSDGDEER